MADSQDQKDKVEKEIEYVENIILNTEPTDDRYESYLDALQKLEDIKAQRSDTIRKDEESKANQQVNWSKVGVDILKTIGGFALTAGCFVAGMNFEQTGTFTATSLKNLLKDAQNFGKYLK